MAKLVRSLPKVKEEPVFLESSPQFKPLNFKPILPALDFWDPTSIPEETKVNEPEMDKK